MARINVFLAYLCGNRGGKRVDVNGRSYRSMVKEYGFKVMSNEFRHGNSWGVKKRVGLI